jgi:hypothetical protein
MPHPGVHRTESSNIKIISGRRTAIGTIALRVPLDAIKAKPSEDASQ